MLKDLLRPNWIADDYLRMMDELKSVVETQDKAIGEVHCRDLDPCSRLHRRELGRRSLAFQ
jgi:hypothetical protein